MSTNQTQQIRFDFSEELREEFGEAKWISTFSQSELRATQTEQNSDAAPQSFVLTVPNGFIKSQVMHRHLGDLQKIIARHLSQSEDAVVLTVEVAGEGGDTTREWDGGEEKETQGGEKTVKGRGKRKGEGERAAEKETGGREMTGEKQGETEKGAKEKVETAQRKTKKTKGETTTKETRGRSDDASDSQTAEQHSTETQKMPDFTMNPSNTTPLGSILSRIATSANASDPAFNSFGSHDIDHAIDSHSLEPSNHAQRNHLPNHLANGFATDFATSGLTDSGLASNASSNFAGYPDNSNASHHAPQPQHQHQPTQRQSRPKPPRTEPRFTFDNFVPGSANRFAYQATIAVAETPGTVYNPLFIFGNVGLGKTHLLQAAAHFVKTHYPELLVRYMATESFLNDFLLSIRQKQGDQFRQKYRQLDVLILDDIQILEGKEALQEELFHTFNYLYDQNKQLIFSSDRHPDALLTLHDRLRSRFKSGLLTDVQPPSIEVRLAILEQSVEQHNSQRNRNIHPPVHPPIVVPNDVFMYIAENFTENIRELEGALTKVLAHAQLFRLPPSLETSQEILGDLIGNGSSQKLNVEEIINIATDFFSLPKEDLLGPCRTKDLVTARHITMYAIREHTDLSLPTIGKIFDGRDHTSVLHALKKINDRMTEDKTTHNQVLNLTNLINKSKHLVAA